MLRRTAHSAECKCIEPRGAPYPWLVGERRGLWKGLGSLANGTALLCYLCLSADLGLLDHAPADMCLVADVSAP